MRRVTLGSRRGLGSVSVNRRVEQALAATPTGKGSRVPRRTWSTRTSNDARPLLPVPACEPCILAGKAINNPCSFWLWLTPVRRRDRASLHTGQGGRPLFTYTPFEEGMVFDSIPNLAGPISTADRFPFRKRAPWPGRAATAGSFISPQWYKTRRLGTEKCNRPKTSNHQPTPGEKSDCRTNTHATAPYQARACTHTFLPLPPRRLVLVVYVQYGQ